MTDRLGEALVGYEKAPYRAEVTWDQKTIVAAARSWHDLTNGDAQKRIARLLHTRWYCRSAQPCGTCQADAVAVLDALTVTPTPEENPPQDFVND